MRQVIRDLLTFLAGWRNAARRFRADALAAYSVGGWRGVRLELRARAAALYSLVFSSAYLYGQLVSMERATEDIRAACRAGVAPETVVRRMCEAEGVEIGGTVHRALVAFAWDVVGQSA